MLLDYSYWTRFFIHAFVKKNNSSAYNVLADLED